MWVAEYAMKNFCHYLNLYEDFPKNVFLEREQADPAMTRFFFIRAENCMM